MIGLADQHICIERLLILQSIFEPLWSGCCSARSFAQILSSGNRELMRVIHDQAPGSLDELSRITGRTIPSLSRTLKTMATYDLVRMEPGHGRRVVPKVLHDRVTLELPLLDRRETKGGHA
ncbi:HVO_A0114 family putative DNA-binding protein [Arboricoccus pini]